MVAQKATHTWWLVVLLAHAIPTANSIKALMSTDRHSYEKQALNASNSRDAAARTDYCLEIVTGTGSHNDGTLDVYVDFADVGIGFVQVASGDFALGATVYSSCFQGAIAAVQIHNPTNNAWAGSMTYSYPRVTEYLVCADCTGSTTSSSSFVADGNTDGAGQGTTQCLNGATCTFSTTTPVSTTMPTTFTTTSPPPTTLTTTPTLFIPSAGAAAAKGDPHLTNVHGERFDLMKTGKHVLIQIPRAEVQHALLRVDAEAQRLGGQCADIYFQELNVTGAWADAKQTGGFRYQAKDAGKQAKRANWVRLGPIQLKVAHGHTLQGVKYLNFYVKNLGRSGHVIGGLLGEDDHKDAEMSPEACVHRMAL